MDCMVMPIQNKLEDWKKATGAIDKEHSKGENLQKRGGKQDEEADRGAAADKRNARQSHFCSLTEFKRHRVQIKKKGEQVLRLRKKINRTSKDGSRPASASSASSSADPSVRRLADQCHRDLNAHFRQLESSEKQILRRALRMDRARYSTFVACIKPVVDEEIGMLSELGQIEDVMAKLAKVI